LFIFRATSLTILRNFIHCRRPWYVAIHVINIYVGYLDIDECAGSLFCPSKDMHGICENTIGYYTCECQRGYNLTETNQTKECKGKIT